MKTAVLRFVAWSLVVIATTTVVHAGEPNVAFPEGMLTSETLSRYLDELIDSLVARDEFSGSILVAKHGEPIYKRAAGQACKRYNIPNRIDTKFNLGSMNKMFTGVAIVQLAQQAKLSFDDKVGKHLPDYPNPEVREKVTIHHLLTHTAGLGQYWLALFNYPQWAYLGSVQDYDNLTNEKPLAFEPGERFAYSNCGPIVLGLLIEKISGMSYDEYIRRHVTGPAGMVNTDCYDIKRPVPNMAFGYTKMGLFGETLDDWHVNLYLHPTKGGPAGGGYSTVQDLLRFDIALRNHRLLEKEFFEILTAGKVDRDEKRRYAYLFEEKIVNRHRIVGHSGGAAGINATLAMYMDSGYTVAIMSNYDGGVGLLRARIEELLTKE